MKEYVIYKENQGHFPDGIVCIFLTNDIRNIHLRLHLNEDEYIYDWEEKKVVNL